eukprot:SAG22_NODE_2022_length_3123_cov_12.497354_4_plen_43_part_00
MLAHLPEAASLLLSTTLSPPLPPAALLLLDLLPLLPALTLGA